MTVAIAGVGETAFERRSARDDTDLAAEAVRAAVADAGLALTDVDGIVAASPGPAVDALAAVVGTGDRRFSATPATVAGAASVGALDLARLAIEAGRADVVVVYYAYQGSKPGGPYAFRPGDLVKEGFEMPVGWYGQPVQWAAWAQRYRYEHGLTEEQLAAVPMAARQWAATAPGAMRPEPLSYEQYLAAPVVATPLRTLDCCLISDGAGAYVVTSLDRARSLKEAPVVVAGVGTAALPHSTVGLFSQNPNLTHLAADQSGERAYRDAGLGPADVDVAEVYDCFTISVILQLEQLGFCGTGEGADFVADGRIAPGGRFPLNTNGGHLAYAYIPGINHVVEAVRQLRGQRGAGQVPSPEVALVAGLGGSDHATAILTVDR